MLMIRIVLLGTLALASASPAQSQVLKKIQQQVKQKIASGKMRIEDSIATHATEPLDSAVSRTARPVDARVAKVGGDAGEVVATAGRKPLDADERRIRDGLAAGRLDLPAVQFDGDVPAESSRETLETLARALAASPNAYLVQVADGPDPTQRLGERRATAVKTWLVAHGVSAARLFAAGAVSGTDTPVVSVTRMQ
jgi:outer membrane protein OmpA-like peptidoglycan-associated protein